MIDSYEMEGPDDITRKKLQTEQDDQIGRLLRPYAVALVRWPSAIILLFLLCLIGSAVLGLVPATGAKEFPSFAEPTKGFEPRGTYLSVKGVAYKNAKSVFGHLPPPDDDANITKHSGRTRRNLQQTPTLVFDQLTYNEWTASLVYNHKDGSDLFKHMHTLCRVHKKTLVDHPSYPIYFYSEYQSQHLANYIAYHAGKADCEAIEQSDADAFKDQLVKCIEPYEKTGIMCQKNNKLCGEILACKQPSSNKIYDGDFVQMIVNVFEYLVTMDWRTDPKSPLTATLSADYGKYQADYYDFVRELYETVLIDSTDKTEVDGVRVVAFSFANFKNDLFSTEILKQSTLIIVAILLVLMLISYFAGSVFIALMTFVCILSSIVIAYFVYGRVFDMDFFPFLNMVTFIFVVGLGADDAFVYVGIWDEAQKIYSSEIDEESRMIKCTVHTLRHAVMAMFITSLTTTSAFYANIASSITCVKCFGLFAGTSIIILYLMMVTFFPAIVILHDKYFVKCMSCCCPCLCSNERQHRLVVGCKSFLSNASDKIFLKFLPAILEKLRHVWVVVFILLGIAGLIITFVEPGLELPSTQEFQFFSSSAPIEQYDLIYKKKFAFSIKNNNGNIGVNYIVGIKDVDNGNAFNPDDKGTLEYFGSGPLDIGSQQLWLKDFCQSLQKAEFYTDSYECMVILKLFSVIEKPCAPGLNKCCGKKLPMPNDEFVECFTASAQYMQSSVVYHGDDPKAIKFFISTNLAWSLHYATADKSFEAFDKFFTEQAARASNEAFQGGWWCSPSAFQFYSLQKSLSSGTQSSFGISLAVALLVILLTTQNVILSIYSMLTITFILSGTVGILVLSGWRLNIIESVIFSVAAGLSADFTLHYSIAYQTAVVKHNRVLRTKYCLGHIGPAILMGATTTFIAGFVMQFASVLSYIQMATFLMLIMFVSWLYSTAFMLPLCMLIGPRNDTGQLNCCCRGDDEKQTQHADNTMYSPDNNRAANVAELEMQQQ